jgi:putative transposase
VTFKYKDSATDQVRFCTVSAEEFMRRFLQHVLPERFVKVRYYGLLSPGNRHLLKRVREALGARTSGSVASSEGGTRNQREPLRCPSCGSEMKLIGTLSSRGREPP